mmetsp:Transcript_183/g.276  ORF Transcript_183/g.276 Transcript_183/m.276 type:complete len:92 (+) Transcript_183:151-426(+)
MFPSEACSLLPAHGVRKGTWGRVGHLMLTCLEALKGLQLCAACYRKPCEKHKWVETARNSWLIEPGRLAREAHLRFVSPRSLPLSDKGEAA